MGHSISKLGILIYSLPNGQIIPYLELPLQRQELTDIPPIKKIWIGPKNSMNKEEIRQFLKRNGFHSEIDIERSKGSYQ
jgi:hypothetical protein